MEPVAKRRRHEETETSGPISAEEVVALLEGSPNILLRNSMTEHDIPEEAYKETLTFLANHWTSAPIRTSEHPLSMPRIAAERFGLTSEFDADDLVPFGRSGLEDVYKRKQLCLIRLKYHFVRLGVMDLEDSSDDVAGAAFQTLFARIHEALARLHDCLLTNLLTRKCLDPQWASDCPTPDGDPFNIVPFDPKKLQGTQRFIVFVIEQLQKKGLRRYRGACYEEIDSPPKFVDGRPKTFKTHAWRYYCDIPEFVNRVAPKETNFEMWQLMLSKDTKSKTIKHLEEGYEAQFRDLEPDRHWHAFPNGLYNTNFKEFYTWGHPRITSNVTACKYHEAEFPEHILSLAEWTEIPTPYFDKILSTQLNHVMHPEVDSSGAAKRYTEAEANEENQVRRSDARELAERTGNAYKEPELVIPGDKILVPEGHKVIEWAYILLGRLLFEVNEKDCWQVMPMFVGRAGTGKSVIASTVAQFFEERDIGLASNDQQKGFGLETLFDKKLWLVKEVKYDFSIDQAQLQSMITGEEMSIQRKNKIALQVVWRAPGLLSGNELPNWADNSGSMSRRMILFYFHKRVSNSDPMLSERLKQELPILMHKCNKAYARAVARYGSYDLWSPDPYIAQALREDADLAATFQGSRTILPSYFHSNRNNLKQQTHLMENFLANKDQVIVCGAHSKRGMPFDKDQDGRPSFKTLANAFFKKQDIRGGFPWNKEDRYRSTFDDYELEVRPLTSRDVELSYNQYCGHDYPVDTMWIFGVVPKTEGPTSFS